MEGGSKGKGSAREGRERNKERKREMNERWRKPCVRKMMIVRKE